MNDSHDHEIVALIARIKSYWSRKGVRLRPAASFQQIKSFESQYKVHLPPDLSRYFATVDGMEEGETDGDMFTFLPLKAVKSIPEELAHFGGIPDYTEIMRSLPDPNRWFVIVDYLVTSAVYAIRLTVDPESSPVLRIGDGTHYHVVASCFSGFLEAYLANPVDLL